MNIPDRHPRGLDNYTIQGLSVSARSGIAYCEIARGTSGKQQRWLPAALYCPPQSDPAYYPGGRFYDGARWHLVGTVNPSWRGYKMILRRSFNPQPAYGAVIHHHSVSDLRVLMETIMEKWYG